MKKITLFILHTSVTVLMSACGDDFLDLSPITSQNSKDFYQTEDQFIQAVNAAYGNLQPYVERAYVMEEMRSDNTTIDYSNNLGVLQRYLPLDQFYIYTDDNWTLRSWRLLYRALNDVNVPLKIMESAQIDQDLKYRLEGELKFLRAFYHFVAVRYWGNIPLITAPMENPDETFNKLREDKEKVYELIIKDLQDAVGLLPQSYSNSDDIGRATKGTALTLLGKVYLTRKNFSAAEQELRKVLGFDYALLDNYADIFSPNNKNHAESIFEVQFKEGDEGEFSSFIYDFAPQETKNVIDISGNTRAQGLNTPTNDMVNVYEPGDLRKDISIGFDTIATNYIGYDTTVVVPFVNKYNYPHSVQGQTGVNWPVLRYADVLLMLAEAINEQRYDPGEPLELVNQVRRRAGLTNLTTTEAPDQVSLRLAIAKERRVELAFENHRWFDLVRMDRALEVMEKHGEQELQNPTTPVNPVSPLAGVEYEIEPYELLYPIPDDEIVVNNNLTQNEGY